MKNKIINITLIISSFMSFISHAENAPFNPKKLSIVCDFFTDNKKECQKEALFLINKNKNNSVVNYCFNKYSTLGNFSNCLKYEYNPIVFLKYQSNKKISIFKDFALKNSSLKCKNSSCFYDTYMTLEKGKNQENWLENHCVFENKSTKSSQECIRKIKKTSKNNNDLLVNIPVISKAFKKAENDYNGVRIKYFEQAYTICTEKYSNTLNKYKCIEEIISPVKKEFINLELETLTCSKNEKLYDFKSCILKNRLN